MTTNECRCGRPTKDAAYVCDHCTDNLGRALGDIPWVSDELETTVARQKGVDYRAVGGGKGGKKPAERPSPINMGAAEARTHLRALLVSWVLFCDTEHVRTTDTNTGRPADELPALSRWLLWRVDGLALNEIGPDAVDEITDAVTRCKRIIDRPADRQYLGSCRECDTGRMYAKGGNELATCEDCGATEAATAIRARLLEELDDRLCTAAEIARLSTYLGLQADRDMVRKRINQWSSRGMLTEHASISDLPTFRFGTVYEMLVGAEYGKKTA